MKYALALLLFAGCVTAYLTPQPTFVTRHPYDLFGRATQAVNENCGGVKMADQDAQLVVSRWRPFPSDAGVVLSQCLVTLLEGDLEAREVRITFSVRRCTGEVDAGTPEELDAVSRTCAHHDEVSGDVYKELTSTADKIEAFLQ